MENGRRNRRPQVSIQRPYCQVLSRYILILGTLRSDNGDRHKNVDENRLRILSPFFRDYSKGPSYLKEGNLVGAEEKGTRPSSYRHDRIYRLAVFVSK